MSALKLAVLEADRERLLDDLGKISGAEPLVVELRALEVLIRSRRSAAKQEDLFTKPDPPASIPESSNGSKHTGFRDAIRDVLSKSQFGLKPAGVTALLRERGFDKANLGTRVAVEMGRMKRTGKLRRSKAGRYRLPKS